MDKKLIYRFFEGKTSYQEEKQIRQWIESSDNHNALFLQERKMYDALLLTGTNSLKREKNIILSYRVAGIVAAILLILVVGGVYLYGFKDEGEQYNTIHVPPGQRINLILSDNTNLWLNANTTFRYPTKFSKETRTVYLDGEAYFEVSKNEKKPFIVKTTQGDIHVTGTLFNVEAYSKHHSFETSLFEGGVDIYKGDTMLATLYPNQNGTLKNGQFLITEITDPDKYLWRKGLIAFNHKDLEDILLKLEKYFDVGIQVHTTKLPQHTYTGKFRQSDGVDYALRVLQKSIQFTYERDDETGTIYIN